MVEVIMSMRPRARGSDAEARDRRLLETWRQGNKRAGSELVSRYYGLLIRFFRNKVSQPEDATDLVSETMLSCVRSRDGIADGRSFRSYVFAVATNVLRQYLRQRSRQADHFDELSRLSIAELELPDSPLQMLVRYEENRLLARALRRIPLEQQIVLELGFFEGLRASAIAELLGIARATVYSRRRRARHNLELAMQQLAEDPALVQSTLAGLQTWARRIQEGLLRSER